MKRLFKNIRVISLLSLLVSFSAVAATEKGLVVNLMGKAFVTRNIDGKSTMIELREGDALFEFDEIFTEVGSQLSFRDNYDHDFHLSGSGYLIVMNRALELKGGYLWVRSYSKRNEDFMVSTVNAHARYDSSDFIISFDQASGKTQVMALKEDVEFANSIHSYLKLSVDAGKFSFISENYENGAPRNPTPIGEATYRKVLTLFDGVDKEFEKRGKRQIVKKEMKVSSPSVKEQVDSKRTPASEMATEPGTMIYVKSPKNTMYKDLLIEKLKKEVQSKSKKVSKHKVFKPDYKTKSGVTVRIFSATSEKSSTRAPASVKEMSKKKMMMRGPASVSPVQIKGDLFEKSLVEEYKKQMRHSKEINSLIKELKNYDQDYKESY